MSRLGNQSSRIVLERLENVVVGESKQPNDTRRLAKYGGRGTKDTEW
jgi:hypothetical protein